MIVAEILFGAGFTIAVSWAVGTLLIAWLRLSFARFEEWLLAFVAGAACLSEVLFLLSTVHLVRRGVLLAMGLIAIAVAVRSVIVRKKWPELPRIGWIPAGIFAAFTVFYFVNALAPEMSPDGAAYHLGMVAKYAQARGFVHLTTNIYASLSEGMELLFLHAFLFGRHSAAALVHLSFLIALALLTISYGRRIGDPVAGVGGAIFVFASPVIGTDASVAYIDVALAAVVFALFYTLQIWDEQRDARLLIPVGVLAGFSYAVKYTGFVAFAYAVGFLLWKRWRAVVPVLAVAAFFIAPWMVKNWVWVGNPLSPFANHLFPNPYVHASFEDYFRQAERSYDLASYFQIPWQLTVDGGRLVGFFGPLFLLTPLALVGLKSKLGRRLLAAGVVFAVPYAFNIGARFLIPSVPFLSLALLPGLSHCVEFLGGRLRPGRADGGVGRRPGGLPHIAILGIAVVHAITCWPSVARLYASPYAWRLVSFPLKAALRIEPEDAYLSRRSPEYRVARLLEKSVPPNEPVFSFSQVAEAYTSRNVLVSYMGAENEKLCDILWNPIIGGLQASRVLKFSFPPREVRKIRVVQTAWANSAQWSVAEFRVFHNGSELPRSPDWRITAWPNRWDVQLAFDNSPLTRWRSWELAKPGMYIEVDFGRSQQIDAVTLETSDDSAEAKVHLETIAGEPTEIPRPITSSQRKAATSEMKARGIRYILVNHDNAGSDDFRLYSNVWGIKYVGEAGGSRLYYIE